MKIGILLINLGTPNAPTVRHVRRYLREFLSDPYVIDLPALTRWILLNAVILPFRTKQTAKAYQKIWTEKGSPLLLNSQSLTKQLQETLNQNYCVELAMRYGNPNIEFAVKKLLSENIDEIIIIPLYPQYAESTTLSSILKAKAILKHYQKNLPVKTLTDFYQDDDYIQAKSQLIQHHLNNKKVDKLIFSYHGLPERHINRICYEKKECDLRNPCPKIQNNNTKCYRAQCYATSHKIAKQLNLSANDYLVTFQSRLGKTPWILPYTDLALNQLAKSGLRNIAIVCPSFIADCLETLEEIDIRAKEQWQKLGGESFIRIPCLNDYSSWISGLARLIQRHSS